MLTTSHAYLTWRVAPIRTAPWAVAGSVAPDALAITAGVALAARGYRGAELVSGAYQRGLAARLTRLMHSALTPSALLSGHPGPRRFAFASGWAGHLALDYLSHHSDAWPPLFPLSNRRFRSPASYWEEQRHSRLVSLAEAAAIAGLALTDRRVWRRRAGFAAAALEAMPAVLPKAFTAHEDATRPAIEGSDNGDSPRLRSG